MTDTDDLVTQLRGRLAALEAEAGERVQELQRRLASREAYAEASGAAYARARADREAAERDELARLGPTFTREELRDPAFFAAHAAEIEQAAKNGRISGVGGLAEPNSAQRETVRSELRSKGMIR